MHVVADWRAQGAQVCKSDFFGGGSFQPSGTISAASYNCTMTAEEKYLFDLRGYLVVRGALSAGLLGRLNETIDELEALGDDQVAARGAPRHYARSDVYAQVGPAARDGLRDYGCPVLPLGGVFEELIDLPTTLPQIENMVAEPCRLDAASFMSRHNRGAFRFHHGGAELLPYSEYAVADGRFACVSVKISYALTDVGVEDGCFAVIPGSHKSNFTNPLVGEVPDPNHPLVAALPCRAGDAVLFTEDLSHGAVENRGSRVRRTLFYSYAPAFHCTWMDQGIAADDFEQRATPRRRELLMGSRPY